MICTARNGNKYMYLMGELRRLDSWCSGMKEDLKNDEYESLDIIAVHNPIGCTINEMLNRDYSTEKPIWKREEPKEMTIAEIEEALGYPIKVIGK